jgi:hypothetical protein
LLDLHGARPSGWALPRPDAQPNAWEGAPLPMRGLQLLLVPGPESWFYMKIKT